MRQVVVVVCFILPSLSMSQMWCITASSVMFVEFALEVVDLRVGCVSNVNWELIEDFCSNTFECLLPCLLQV